MRRLTSKQQKFVDAYIRNGGNGTQAVWEAGYDCKNANSARAQSSDNLRKPNIRLAMEEAGYRDSRLINTEGIIEARNVDLAHRKISTREDRAEFLTGVYLDESHHIVARLKAVELLGKMYGDFLDRVVLQKEDIQMPVIQIICPDDIDGDDQNEMSLKD